MTTEPLRVVYAGTPEFAVPALRALLDGPHTVAAVYTQPDRPAGRGRRLRPGPVKLLAEAAGVPVRQPETLRSEVAAAEFRALAPDVMIVVAYGLILPRAILDTPRHGCLNLHASLLPRWRGAAPIHRALLAGDPATGVCLMRMVAGLDAGPVIARREIAITPQDTAGTVHDRLACQGAELLDEALPRWAADELSALPQPAAGVTYAGKLSTAEAQVRWDEGAVAIDRRIRAFDPWPVARARAPDGSELRLWRALPLPGPAGAEPGAVLAVGTEGIDVATGDGILRLLEVQPAGGRRQSAAAYLNGHSMLRGERFGGAP